METFRNRCTIDDFLPSLSSTGIFYGVIVAALLGGIEGVAITIFAVCAKTASNIAWFIMWVQAK